MELLDDLKEAGLTEYEAKAYRALIEYGEQTARGVSEISKIPPTRVFDALKSLRENGLVELVQQKPMVWMAIKPEAGIGTLMQRKSTAYSELGKRLVSELKHTRQEPRRKILENVTIQGGSDKVIETVTRQIASSVREACGYFIGDPLPSYAEISNAKAISRGLTIRQIVRKYTSENRRALERWLKDGWKLKYLPGTEDYSFFVFDRKRCAIVVKDPHVENEKIIILFENEGLSNALHDYFESIWSKAKSLSDVQPSG